MQAAKLKIVLLPIILCLLIIELLAMPFVIGYTYALGSESPNHVLTYTENKLSWDSQTAVEPNGSARLNVFSAQYENVASQTGENIIAPGTTGTNIIRLKNGVSGAINYTALLYIIKADNTIPVKAILEGEGFNAADSYFIPKWFNEEQVVYAVEGSLGGGKIQDFNINWLWQYYENDMQDEIDTLIGLSAADNADTGLTLGVYITVEDNNSYIPPSPYTKDNTFIGIYLALLLVSATLFIVLVIDRERHKKCALEK